MGGSRVPLRDGKSTRLGRHFLASSAPPSLGYGAPGERSIHRVTQRPIPRQDNRNVAEKSHFFLYN
jgi:hypothetical protein